MGMMDGRVRLLVIVLSGWLAAPVLAQVPVVTAADYARAERLVGYNANLLVDHAVTRVTWLIKNIDY